MVSKSNHRTAFAADAKFLARLQKQGVHLGGGDPPVATVPGDPATVASAAPRNESKATTRLKKVREANMDGRFDRLVYDSESNSLTAFFPGALLLSLNVMLRVHDAKGTSLKATWLKRVEALKWESREVVATWQARAAYPVVVEEVYLTPESGLMDHEAVSAACKPIIDAFVANGFLPDDNGKYIAHPMAYTERAQKGGVLIRFRATKKPWGLIEDSTVDFARLHMGLKN